jgi:hypothetical protein
MLGHQSPKETLETLGDLFDTDLDALGHVLDQARAVALQPPTVVKNNEPAGKFVSGGSDGLDP